MRNHLLLFCFFGFSECISAQTVPNSVLQDRAILPSNFLSQTIYQINSGIFYNATSKPSTSQSEGCLVYQNVNSQTNGSNYSVSLYSDLYSEDLYMNTGLYGTAGNNWKGWVRFLNSNNFFSYALPLTGGNITGNLGIGTSTPSQKLEVTGNILSDGNVYIGGGNGITVGTKTAGYALAVNGAAIFTQAVVKLYTNWPDYVFEPAYKLRTLSSLNEYIQTNKHLPDMPTADDIRKKGVNLGDAQAALLKKVEELTLYIIAQENKAKDQQASLEKMQEEIKILEATVKKLVVH